MEPPDLPHPLDHLDHLVKLAGTAHVGLGLDFWFYLLDPKSPVERSAMRKGAYLSVDGLESDADVPKLPKLLAARGYDRRRSTASWARTSCGCSRRC